MNLLSHVEAEKPPCPQPCVDTEEIRACLAQTRYEGRLGTGKASHREKYLKVLENEEQFFRLPRVQKYFRQMERLLQGCRP